MRSEPATEVTLLDRSRALLSHPHAVATVVVERVLAARRHPRQGPRELLAVLRRQEPTREWPVASTGRWHPAPPRIGLAAAPASDRPPYAERIAEYAASNAIWCGDSQGHFPVGEDRCHPLTIMDGKNALTTRG